MQWLSPGSATFCKFTTKLELEEELTQELGIFCRLSSALGLNFGLKFNKTFARFKALFVGIADIKAVLLFREQRDFRKGTTALLAKPQFSPPMTSPFLGKF